MASTVKKTKARLEAFCPRFHQAVELIGKRWNGAIIRLLLSGGRRFNEIASAVPGLSGRLLTERLRELERAGIISREIDDGPPVRVAYGLTASGRELEATVRALADWSERWVPARPDRMRGRA
jgi:DNA-binding HxlR family transcriptional regulator